MRALALLALSIVLASGCEAVDNFDKFTFGKANADLGEAPDLSPAVFAAACTTNGCAQYGGPLPTMCEQAVSGGSFPEGMCTRPCQPALAGAACAEYADSICSPLFNAAYCLLRCGAGTPPCRKNYVCCNKNGINSACAPADACK